MCFFNAMSLKATQVASRYRRKFDAVEAWKHIMAERERATGQRIDLKDVYKYRLAEGMYSIPAYAEPHCVIVSGSDQLQVMQWGLIPRRASVADRDRYNIKNWFKNARAEEIFDKWPWRNLIYRQRCIIPSTGYYEYHYDENGKTQPFFIHLTDREVFSMAGLWDRWENPDNGELIESFVQITTAANAFTEKIHNGGANPFRMPLILEDEDEQKWLDAELTDRAEIEKLLKPYRADNMVAHPVNKNFKLLNPYDERTAGPTPDQRELDF